MAFTSQPLPTPGFFSAAIQTDNDNPFDNAFGKGGSSPNPQTSFGDSSRHEQNFFAPINSGGYNGGYVPCDFLSDQQQPKMNLNGWDFGEKVSDTLEYPDPSIVRSNASPPLSTSTSPDWAFRGYHDQATGPSSLQTSNIGVDPRVQYGQITPPDDNDNDNGKSTNQAFDTNMPDEVNSTPSYQKSARSSISKRKRASTSTEQNLALAPGAIKLSRMSLRSRSKKGENIAASVEDNVADGKDEKRSKFLERNRVAASKCRQKKKEWTSALEAKARDLQAEKAQLQVMLDGMTAEVMYLKNEMLHHTQCGCSNIRDYMAREAEAIAKGDGGYSPSALLRRRELRYGKLTRSDGDASSRRASVMSGMTNAVTTDCDEESVIGGDIEMREAS